MTFPTGSGRGFVGGSPEASDVAMIAPGRIAVTRAGRSVSLHVSGGRRLYLSVEQATALIDDLASLVLDRLTMVGPLA